MKINEIENNIENFEKYMTVYFNKETGKIVACPSGINDMTPYKDYDPALLSIWDYEILPLDRDVMFNRDNFIIQDSQIKLTKTPKKPKYEVAE